MFYLFSSASIRRARSHWLEMERFFPDFAPGSPFPSLQHKWPWNVCLMEKSKYLRDWVRRGSVELKWVSEWVRRNWQHNDTSECLLYAESFFFGHFRLWLPAERGLLDGAGSLPVDNFLSPPSIKRLIVEVLGNLWRNSGKIGYRLEFFGPSLFFLPSSFGRFLICYGDCFYLRNEFALVMELHTCGRNLWQRVSTWRWWWWWKFHFSPV